MLADSLQDQLSRLRALDEQIARIEQRILDWRRNDDACRRISEIPGVGALTATAAVSVIRQATTFRSGREFSAYLGLVPRQNGSGGKVKLGGRSCGLQCNAWVAGYEARAAGQNQTAAPADPGLRVIPGWARFDAAAR
jgi:transposase